jgi:uncharacterized membrane protein YphA (DoxX/SURF4 family)
MTQVIQSALTMVRAGAWIPVTACGAGLALGLLTPLCAAMLTGDMTVAITTTSIHSIQAKGFLAR